MNYSVQIRIVNCDHASVEMDRQWLLPAKTSGEALDLALWHVDRVITADNNSRTRTEAADACAEMPGGYAQEPI